MKKKILIIGDIFLDIFSYGLVKRISPESDVPVLNYRDEMYKLGGAANVALNLKSLDANATLIGKVGNDNYGKKIKSIINIGTSNPRSFFDVAKIVCKHMNKKEIIIQDIPILIKKNYQYFTCCNNTILKKLKLINNFTSLELGIKKYIHRLNNSPF